MKWLLFVLLTGVFVPAGLYAQTHDGESEPIVIDSDPALDAEAPPSTKGVESSDRAAPGVSPTAKPGSRDCGRGYVDIEGECCFPGRSLWAGVCVGEPQCPEGMHPRDLGGVKTICEADDQVAWFQEGCDAGSLSDCLQVAIVQARRAKVYRNLNQAMSRMEELCRLDYSYACYEVGYLYWAGVLVVQDRDAARPYLDKACTLGDLRGCVAPARDDAASKEEEDARQLQHAEALCGRGSDRHCLTRAVLLYKLGKTDDERREAIELLAENCEDKMWNSCRELDKIHWCGPEEYRDVAGVMERAGEGCSRGSVLHCKLKADILLRGPDDVRDADRGVALLERACTGHSNSACRDLAGLYYHGKHVELDQKRAAQLYDESCQRGYNTSCALLGVLHWRGEGVEKDLHTARDLFAYACEGGDRRGCSELGVFHRRDDGMRDDREARRFYLRACKADDFKSCNRLATLYQEGLGGEPDLAAARELLQAGCERRDNVACANLGSHYQNYYLTDTGKELARALFEHACALGNAVGCERNAKLLRDPLFNDPAGAARYFGIGCELDREASCVYLADLLSAHLEGVPVDLRRARELYVEACRRGSAFGCARIGQMYMDGEVVARDDARARRFFDRACKGDLAWACYYQAILYRDGRGGEKSLARAQELFAKACKGGDDEACALRKR